MKTKTIMLKFVIGLVLVAMVQTVALSQNSDAGSSSSFIACNNSVYSQVVVVDSNLNIKDWMVDDMAFDFRSEKANLEDWMIMYDNESDNLLIEECIGGNWVFDMDVLPTMELVDWMIEDQPYIDCHFSEMIDDVDLMDWMVIDDRFGKEIEDESVKLQQWMLHIDGIGEDKGNDLVLEDWMLDQKFWN